MSLFGGYQTRKNAARLTIFVFFLSPFLHSISFTQPEALQKGSLHLGSGPTAGGLSMLPMSTAQPRLSSAARRGAFQDSLSQQFLHRRNEFAASQAQSGNLPSGSQFTDAIHFMTQPGATPFLNSGGGPRSAFYTAANLTRFYSTASVGVITSMLSRVLHQMRVQHEVEPLGDAMDENGPIPEPRESGEEMDMDGAGEARRSDGISRSSSNETITDQTGGTRVATTTMTGSVNAQQGSRGSRIRLSLMDRRKCILKGEIRIERVTGQDQDDGDGDDNEADRPVQPRATVLMRRSRGNPLEWRRMFRDIVRHDEIGPFIVRG